MDKWNSILAFVCTTVYIKLVAPDALSLTEGLSRNLGVVCYHPNVQAVQKGPVAIMPSRRKTRSIQGDLRSRGTSYRYLQLIPCPLLQTVHWKKP